MIYLDHAATTPVGTEVLQSMLPYFSDKFYNPSGVYEPAAANKKEIDSVREVIANSIQAKKEEIYFTSGGTESDNWTFVGIANALSEKGKHIITSKVEHHAILHTCEYLEKQGFEVTYLDVNEDGGIKIEELLHAIRKDTILISIMFANNEVGTIQPIAQIGKIAEKYHICFHTDAVQAFMHVPIDVNKLHIDMMSASAHKFEGPKGIGFLYIRDGIVPESFMHGGKQESGKRAGTENVPAIVGMGKAVKMASEKMKQNTIRTRNMRDYLLYRIMNEIPDVKLNGSKSIRLPGNINISIKGVEGESLIIMLDMEGICVSGGSACTAGLGGGSHVLKAMGLSPEEMSGALRITIGEENTMEEMDIVAEKLKEKVKELRG